MLHYHPSSQQRQEKQGPEKEQRQQAGTAQRVGSPVELRVVCAADPSDDLRLKRVWTSKCQVLGRQRLAVNHHAPSLVQNLF
jgi:hypothetical protein